MSDYERSISVRFSDLNFKDGRPEYVSILDCYLKKNLAINGGYLDEVHWMTNTDKHFDLKYLDYLVSTSEYYKKIVINELSYDNAWQHAVQNDTMYIKIDDDIVGNILALSRKQPLTQSDFIGLYS